MLLTGFATPLLRAIVQPKGQGVHHQAEILASKLPPLLVAADRIAATVSQGVHGRRRVGQGETFWQFRRYQPGDSAHNIDWRQSAKSQPVYVREVEWEAAESVWLWWDCSPSMDYRSMKSLPRKAERAALLMLALASLLVKGGERVALLGSGRAPMSGRGFLSRLVLDMEKALEHSETFPSLPNYEQLPRYARIVLISDFLEPLEDVKNIIAAFAKLGVQGHMLQIVDPAEETLPFSGRVRFQGLENEGEVLIPRTESMRKEYKKAMCQHNEGLAGLARTAGWSFAAHHTDQHPEMALLALFMALSG